MLGKIEQGRERILEISKRKPIRIISHYDTDGITSAAIFSRALSRHGKNFSLEIVKALDKEFIKNLPENEALIFLDLGSGSLNFLKEKKTEVFIFDHHEIIQEIPENIFIVNPVLQNHEPLSSSAICYLFARSLSFQNKDLSNLAIIGMIGDQHDKNISKRFNEVLNDADAIIKKGLMIYPSTRPLNIALEFCSMPYLPGISGSREGVTELLRDSGLFSEGGKYKALYELSEDEMTRLITSLMLKAKSSLNIENLIGNLFLVKFFNKLEDARELSALINACGRMDYPEVALGFCLGNKLFREQAEKIYISYKQNLISALRYISESEKISGENYMIINAGGRIKDTIIGTIASIVSYSPIYKEGFVIVALAYNGDKIKVSARIAGRKGRNVREILTRAVVPIGGEVGGHPNAAGCLISRKQEVDFIKELKKILDVEFIKI